MVFASTANVIAWRPRGLASVDRDALWGVRGSNLGLARPGVGDDESARPMDVGTPTARRARGSPANGLAWRAYLRRQQPDSMKP
jgi:hypothetical protein